MASTRDPDFASRKIYFFKVFDEGGDPDFAFDRETVVRSIESLDHDSPDFYLEESDDRITCAVVDRTTQPARIRFYKIRRRDLPEKDSGRGFEDLLLDPTEGLAEAVHVVLYEDNVIGMEFSAYGPSIARIRAFLAEKCDSDVTLRHLVRKDVIDHILSLDDIRFLRIKVDPSVASIVQDKASGLGGAFDAAELFNAGRYMDLSVSSRPDDMGFTDKVKSLFRTLRDEQLSGVLAAAEVRGYDADLGSVEDINVLQDRIVRVKDIRRVRRESRALDADEAYGAIDEAYREIEDELGDDGTITARL